MNIQLHLIVIACIANFVLIFVQPDNQMVNQAAVHNEVTNERETLKNDQHLFNSGVEKDTRKNGIYYKFLIKKLTREQQAFDTMKEELWSTQVRNTFKKSNRRIGDSENIVAVKREASAEIERLMEMERAYVDKYGTDRMTSGVWDWLNQFKQDEEKLSLLAREAHRLAGMGDVCIQATIKEERWLDFCEPEKYNSIVMDVLVYSVKGHVKNDTRISFFYYMTKGLRPDCVHYLSKENLKEWRLKLDKHVCGVPMQEL